MSRCNCWSYLNAEKDTVSSYWELGRGTQIEWPCCILICGAVLFLGLVRLVWSLPAAPLSPLFRVSLCLLCSFRPACVILCYSAAQTKQKKKKKAHDSPDLTNYLNWIRCHWERPPCVSVAAWAMGTTFNAALPLCLSSGLQGKWKQQPNQSTDLASPPPAAPPLTVPFPSCAITTYPLPPRSVTAPLLKRQCHIFSLGLVGGGRQARGGVGRTLFFFF